LIYTIQSQPLRGFFKDNVTSGDIRQKGHGRGVTRGTRGPDSPPVNMQYVYTVEHNFYVTSLRSSTFVCVSTHQRICRRAKKL